LADHTRGAVRVPTGTPKMKIDVRIA